MLSVLHEMLYVISGGWTRTSDLRVMSPTSCQLLYPAFLIAPYPALNSVKTISALTASPFAHNMER